MWKENQKYINAVLIMKLKTLSSIWPLRTECLAYKFIKRVF